MFILYNDLKHIVQAHYASTYNVSNDEKKNTFFYYFFHFSPNSPIHWRCIYIVNMYVIYININTRLYMKLIAIAFSDVVAIERMAFNTALYGCDFRCWHIRKMFSIFHTENKSTEQLTVRWWCKNKYLGKYARFSMLFTQCGLFTCIKI